VEHLGLSAGRRIEHAPRMAVISAMYVEEAGHSARRLREEDQG